MARSKTISLFLVDGDPTSRWICKLTNWNGVGFKIPRTMLKSSKGLDYLDTPGVYFLIGKTEDESQTAVYIGETEDVHYRLMQHANNPKEWQDWTECVAFCSKDTSLNKAKIKNMENILYNLALNAGRCKVLNGNEPRKSTLSMEDEAEVEEYMDNLKVVLGAMGYRFLQNYVPVSPVKPFEPSKPAIQTTPLESFIDKNPEVVVFNCTSKKIGCDAQAALVSEGILVLKGSRIRKEVAPNFKKHGYYLLRENLISTGIIVDDVFVCDHLFKSPSAAAAVICGSATNGKLVWVNDKGQPIADYLSCMD